MTTEAAAVPRNALSIATTPGTSTTNSTAPAAGTTGTTTMGATDFLSLLTTELKNQDPLNPVDSTQSVAQLAQFSSLQATTTLSTNFGKFESNFAVSQASGMLGDSVTVASTDSNGNASTVSGTVKTIQVINGLPQFTMTDANGKPIADTHGNPVQFTTSQITGITK